MTTTQKQDTEQPGPKIKLAPKQASTKSAKSAKSTFTPIKELPDTKIERCQQVLFNKMQCWRAGDILVENDPLAGKPYQLCQMHATIKLRQEEQAPPTVPTGEPTEIGILNMPMNDNTDSIVALQDKSLTAIDGSVLQIDGEYMTVLSAADQNNLSVQRATNGSIPTVHVALTQVLIWGLLIA